VLEAPTPAIDAEDAGTPMDDKAWVMYLVNLASYDNIARRPAIRSLYFAGHEVWWISEAADVPVVLVQDALARIP
jgi:hypothetical protein